MTARSFPVPIAHQGGVLGATATLDRIDLAASLGDNWARRLLDKENARTLAPVLGEDPRLPVAVMDDDAIVGLYRDGLTWLSGGGWVAAAGPPPSTELIDASTVAFVARALEEGYQAVVAYPYTPLALLAAKEAANPGMDGADMPDELADGAAGQLELPAGAKALAVVDQYDRDAVMDLVIVLPGPKVMRRHAGEWRDDPKWINVLRGVRPPPVVELDPDQLRSVTQQIDEATADLPFDETKEEEAGKAPRPPLAASAWLEREDEMTLAWALMAASKVVAKASPTGAMPHQLKQYWQHGPGAAKIRWGTTGAMRRCHRHLSKYINPERAWATCNNISKALGGKGVAWDVG